VIDLSIYYIDGGSLGQDEGSVLCIEYTYHEKRYSFPVRKYATKGVHLKGVVFMRKLVVALVSMAALAAFVSMPAFSADAGKMTVEQLFQQKDQLAGKTVQLSGKVVKVNNGIMRRNFVHIVDGSGTEGSNKVIVTSKNTAAVGDHVSVSGVVTLNRDFGMGYSYPLLVEQASISKQ
jgi:hypothetical protein